MGKTVTKEFIYNTSPEKLWNALTEKKEMKSWYFDLEEFKPEVGFVFNLSKLKLSHAGFETFPTDNPDLDPKNFDEGWEYILGTSLKNYFSLIFYFL